MPFRSSAHFAVKGVRQSFAAVLELHGELDLAVKEELVAEYRTLLAEDPAVVVVDLRDLSFMDAAGLGALTRIRTECRQQGRRFALIQGPRAVQRLFAVCGVEHIFPVVDNACDALDLVEPSRTAPAAPRALRLVAPCPPEAATMDTAGRASATSGG
jgi:anti-sigma B factor antagonist